jgi:pseudaminic acid biosynthesis-associated methylase
LSKRRPVDDWRGEFGASYIERNRADQSAVRQRALMWGRFLWPMAPYLPKSILEVGCNVGINLRALERLVDAELYAIEPNAAAREAVISDGVLPSERIFDADAGNLPFEDGAMELTFTTGVLIHVPPDELPGAIDELYRVSSRFILMSEYFADQPEEKAYRGHEGLLFKRDFGKLMLERHPDLTIVDYGFLWREACGADNGNWWLFRKVAG